MADMTAALRDRLRADPVISDMVGSRVYRMERPQGTDLPAITIQEVPTGLEQTHKGFQEQQSSLIQIDVWAASYGAKMAIKDAVLAAAVPPATVSGIKFGRAFVERDGDRSATGSVTDQDGLPFIHRRQIDLTVWHSLA